MIERLCDRELEDSITEILESLVGLGVAYMCLIEDASMDAGEDIEGLITWENLERREE
jgi:hypothetical protein